MQQATDKVNDKADLKKGLNWNEAIREYAELYHKSELDKASAELPSYGEIEKEFPTHGHYDDLINSEQLGKQSGAKWMKEQTSVAIAKLKGMYDESIKQNDLLQEYIQEKDKTIDYLQKKIEFLSTNKP